jgi:hypothetical protein
MQTADQLRERFRLQRALAERLGVNAVGASEEKNTTPRRAVEKKVG